MLPSMSNGGTVTDVLIGAAVVILLIVRQLRTQQVRDSSGRITLILGVLGVVEVASDVHSHGLPGVAAAMLAGSLVLAALFGAARAATVKLWQRDGQVWRRGTWLTAVLWAVSLAAHIGLGILVSHSAAGRDLDSASILLYLAVTMGLQRLLILVRARRMFPAALAAG